MKMRKFIRLSLGTLIALSMLAGCGGKVETSSVGADEGDSLEPITFTIFTRNPGQVPSKDNPVLKKITEETGVTLDIEYLVGDLDQKIGVMLAAEDYPDMVYGATNKFIDAGACLELDDLIDQYAPHLKEHYAPYDAIMKLVGKGKIQELETWGRTYGDPVDTWHSGAAFWIQKDVLAEAGYVIPHTLDEYFTLIEDYMAKHPTIDGQPTSGFEVLSDGWRSFCLTNAPQHLIGGPNQGGVYVNPETTKAEIYADKDYAKTYFEKLNEEYNKGVIPADTFTQTNDQYMAKISTGRVLGMFDQHWAFSDGESALKNDKKYERTYVPLPITYEGYTDYYREREVFTGVNGIVITKNCKEPERLIKFLDRMMEDDMQRLLTWGIEGEDYTVDEDGVMHMTDEFRENRKDSNWVRDNTGNPWYSLLPKKEGWLDDKNTAEPGNMLEEYQKTLSDYEKDFLGHYNFNSIVDFLSVPPENALYYPVWSLNLGEGSEAAVVEQKLKDLQLKYLPNVITQTPDNFNNLWDEYVGQIKKAQPEVYENKVNELIQEKLTYVNK